MISVIIPSYNRAKTVKRAVESVLTQSWKDLEVILIDDGSSDTTKTVIESINDPRVRYTYQENAGACVARNHGIDLADGEYIAFHDSDDVWRPDKLDKQMKALLQNNADIVFCRLVKHNLDGTETLKPSDCKEGFMKPITNLFGIGTQTILAKRKVFDELRFDKDFPRLQEFELLYRAVKSYSIYCVDEGLVDYYVGSDSISSNPEKMYRACELILQKHPEIAKNYPVMGGRMAQYLLSAGNQISMSGKGGLGKYITLSRKCKKDIKLTVKAVMIYTGIYSKWKKSVH